MTQTDFKDVSADVFKYKIYPRIKEIQTEESRQYHIDRYVDSIKYKSNLSFGHSLFGNFEEIMTVDIEKGPAEKISDIIETNYKRWTK